MASSGLVCAFWGALRRGEVVHRDCPVIVRDQGQGVPPTICECDCQVCKRKWWDMGRPMHKGNMIVTDSGRTIT